jgi:hypothetical protein
MTQAVQFLSLVQAHVAAHFIEYSPLLIALLLWLVSRSPEGRKAGPPPGPRLQPVCTERAGSH